MKLSMQSFHLLYDEWHIEKNQIVKPGYKKIGRNEQSHLWF